MRLVDWWESLMENKIKQEKNSVRIIWTLRTGVS